MGDQLATSPGAKFHVQTVKYYRCTDAYHTRRRSLIGIKGFDRCNYAEAAKSKINSKWPAMPTKVVLLH